MGRDAFGHQVQLMSREAKQRLADATRLNSAFPPTDSGYLLELLALEILLKAVSRIHGQDPHSTHRYNELFAALPSEVRDRLLESATETRATADYSSPDTLLDTLGRNFVRLRYPYESYVGLSQSEYEDLGAEWATRGSELAEAEFVYHPAELNGLSLALDREVDAWLIEHPE